MDRILSLFRMFFSSFQYRFFLCFLIRSSTLENWVREFTRFAPSIKVQTYYGSKDERVHLRQNLLDTRPHKNTDDGWNVLITTYNLAQGDGDRKFFRRIDWDVRFSVI